MNSNIILLVEDNPDDVELTRDALRRGRVLNELLVMTDGAAALDFLQRASGEEAGANLLPVVVLLDLNLPKLNGFELLKAIRGNERLPRLPVIILTASQEEEDVFKCYELYADGFLRKPVDSLRFSEAIKQAGLGWHLSAMPSPPESPRIKPDEPL